MYDYIQILSSLWNEHEPEFSKKTSDEIRDILLKYVHREYGSIPGDEYNDVFYRAGVLADNKIKYSRIAARDVINRSGYGGQVDMDDLGHPDGTYVSKSYLTGPNCIIEQMVTKLGVERQKIVKEAQRAQQESGDKAAAQNLQHIINPDVPRTTPEEQQTPEQKEVLKKRDDFLTQWVEKNAKANPPWNPDTPILDAVKSLCDAIWALIKSFPDVIKAFNAAMDTWKSYEPAMAEVKKLMEEYQQAKMNQSQWFDEIDRMVDESRLSTTDPNPPVVPANFDFEKMERYRIMFNNRWVGDQARSYLNLKMQAMYQRMSGVGYPTELHAMAAAAGMTSGMPGSSILSAGAGMLAGAMGNPVTAAAHNIPKLFAAADIDLWQIEGAKMIAQHAKQRTAKEAQDLNRVYEIHGNE